MIQHHVPVMNLQHGDLILKLGSREVESSFTAHDDVKPGQHGVGPRGGRYVLRQGLEDEWVIVVLRNGRRPIVKRTSFATVIRQSSSDA